MDASVEALAHWIQFIWTISKGSGCSNVTGVHIYRRSDVNFGGLHTAHTSITLKATLATGCDGATTYISSAHEDACAYMLLFVEAKQKHLFEPCCWNMEDLKQAGWLDAYLLLGLVDTLQVTAGYVGAVEGLSHILSVARQDLALQVCAHGLDVIAPAGEERSGERRWENGRQRGGNRQRVKDGKRLQEVGEVSICSKADNNRVAQRLERNSRNGDNNNEIERRPRSLPFASPEARIDDTATAAGKVKGQRRFRVDQRLC